MSIPAITLAIKDYDFLAPLACGDVVAEGIDLTVNRDTRGAMARFMSDPSLPAGEISFSKHLMRLARGDRSIVAIPFFAYRAFRHRCFLIRRDSGLAGLKDLAGKRIGTNGWPDTGNTWSRAALREQGVSIEGIQWWIGPLDDPSQRMGGSTPIEIDLPPNVRLVEAGRTLREMLLAGALDALMVPRPPRGFYEVDSPIVRLIPDYRRAEQEYCRRTGIFPGHHVVGIREEVFRQNPDVAVLLYQALERSKLRWQDRCRDWAETSPWFLTEIEEASALIGHDWHPNGVEANRRMLEALCDEEHAQGLISRRLAVSEIFAEFDGVAGGA